MEELDDEEDDWELDMEYDPEECYWVKDAQEWEKYKELGKRLEEEEKEQVERMSQKGEDDLMDDDDSDSVNNIMITTEMVYDAPEGTATVDRFKPLPQDIGSIVQTLDMPIIDISPEDPEYKVMTSMWKTLARNPTLNKAMKESMIKTVATACHMQRGSGKFEKILELPDEISTQDTSDWGNWDEEQEEVMPREQYGKTGHE
ncbi:unnamed protein product [Discosporangium mesarthrocarpum]